MKKIISIVNQKGGTGKTTTTLSLGGALAYYGKKVLLIDMDPQASLSFCLGINEVHTGVESLIYNETQLKDTIVETEGLHVIPTTIRLADAEIDMLKMNNRERILKDLLAVSNYDFVLIDCPPSLSILTVNALVAADLVLTPVLPEILSVRGLELILNTVDEIKKSLNHELGIAGILPVMIDRRKKLDRIIIDKIKREYDINIFQSCIHTSVQLAEAPMHSKSIISQKPNSKSSSDYLNLAKELMAMNYK
ncbi:AAA family ATPase [Fulvivirga sp. 29W222]|uniref:AAA family ATPase n=1 Tax=Fulvivirga marina TaxID=2494733 RepID=A0A937FW74_9BACT|nr:ParA family protein [Fulvivirga marina]MBL6447114.1 AAA family ATPase [Fulvivirga marina]